MSEKMLIGMTGSLAIFLDTANTEWHDAWAILENASNRCSLDNEQRPGPLLRKYPFNFNPEDYSSGCLFNGSFCLRWEREEGGFRLVYIGSELATGDLSPVDENLETFRDLAYDLWGVSVDPQRVGTAAGQSVFAELRIPRLLNYPVTLAARRVRLVVREYYDAATGQLTAYRFCALEEVAN